MNKRKTLKASVCVMLLLGMTAGCSKDKDEKGAVEKMSDKVADKAVEQMTKPIDKAKDSQALQNAQNQKLEEMTKESGEQAQK